MGDEKKTTIKSRRWFLTGGLLGNEKKKMVKMLTADGKLVEVERSVLDAAPERKKAANKDIYEWMNNPSKENK